MKHRYFAALLAAGALAVLVCGGMLYQNNRLYSGRTPESRALLLDKALAPGSGTHWQIVAETTAEGYLISGAHSTQGGAALAVFKPLAGGKYALHTSVAAGQDDILADHILLDGRPFDLFWFGGAQTVYAQVTHTAAGTPQTPVRYDTAAMPVLCVEGCSGEYTVDIAYWGADGTVYR